MQSRKNLELEFSKYKEDFEKKLITKHEEVTNALSFTFNNAIAAR